MGDGIPLSISGSVMGRNLNRSALSLNGKILLGRHPHWLCLIYMWMKSPTEEYRGKGCLSSSNWRLSASSCYFGEETEARLNSSADLAAG